MQPNNTPNQSKSKSKESPPGKSNSFIRLNESVSKEIDTAADIIDKNISPAMSGEFEKNKTQIYFILGEDIADNGDMKTNFRFGAQLHLPRFEQYWKVKFANQDEKKDRGRSSMTRDQRTRNTNDDIFVGVSFSKNWDRIEVQYKPQIAINDGVGLDHSIEAETEYEFGNFNFKPSLEFFANHEEGIGTSSVIKFIFWLKKSLVALEQGNDARFLHLGSNLSENHNIGIVYFATERLGLSLHYFRSFANIDDYRLDAYGGYFTANYVIYKDMLGIEVKPYIVYERIDNFEQTNGVVANFRVIF